MIRDKMKKAPALGTKGLYLFGFLLFLLFTTGHNKTLLSEPATTHVHVIKAICELGYHDINF